MGIFSDRKQRISDAENLSQMERGELNRCFSGQIWSDLSYTQRVQTLQELENRFAAEQGRPAKQVVPETMEGSVYGGWNEHSNKIVINESLIRNGCFVSHGISNSAMPDASVQLYDTIAHEGYHAYQSYAVEHPEIHADKRQLERWRLNGRDAVADGHYQHNYYQYDDNHDLYRIQPLEKDAFAYGEAETKKAFDAIEARMGNQEGYDYYKQQCAMKSYDNALREAQCADPQIEEHMQMDMQQRERSWDMGKSCETTAPSAANYKTMECEAPQDLSALRNNYQLAGQYENPYKYDEDQTVKVLTLGGSESTTIPSLKSQYEQAVRDLQAQYPNWSTQQASGEQYMQGLRTAQDDLGYYPQYDPRMGSEYEQRFSQQFGEALNSAVENAGPEELHSIRDNLSRTAVAYRSGLAAEMGYIPYEQSQEQVRTVSENETEESALNQSINGELEAPLPGRESEATELNIGDDGDYTPEQGAAENISLLPDEAENYAPEKSEAENMSLLPDEAENYAPEQSEGEDMARLSQLNDNTISTDDGGEHSESEEISL